MIRRLYLFCILCFSTMYAVAAQPEVQDSAVVTETVPVQVEHHVGAEMQYMNFNGNYGGVARSIYDCSYSTTARLYDWKRLWINTAVLGGAFLGTLLVLECLPEDATSWNRAELRSVPLFQRWKNHVLVKGPEWDRDKFYFNSILHPYAGAVYYMSARSCGFNLFQSLLYCTLVSNVGWEFGVEAFMERPSIQDIIITPMFGCILGECFYLLKRHIVSNNYELFGSSLLGNIASFIIDPVNEIMGLFVGNPCRQKKSADDGLSSSFVLPVSNEMMKLGVTVSHTF